MNDLYSEQIIAQTKKWITDVVVGCNFCPFAAKELKRGSIHYQVLATASTTTALEATLGLLHLLDDKSDIETAFLILPESFQLFDVYLSLVERAEQLLCQENYEGIYQVAGFHPEYLFAGSTNADPANYTNRSPYAMLHFLREDSVSKAVDNYPGINEVPERNIAFTREKGLRYMQQLLMNSF